MDVIGMRNPHYNNRFNLIAVCSTTRCNASCKYCGRTILARDNNLDKTDLDFNILDPLLPRTDFISLCGITGDVIFHPDLPNFVQKCQDYEYLTLEIATNGDHKDESFWRELGKLKNIEVMFGIDSIDNNEKMYRKGTDFNRVIRNAEVFIESGGNATWQCLVFEYNYDQIDQMEKLAKQIGFSEYRACRSNAYDDEFKQPKGVLSKQDVYKQTKDELSYYCYWYFRNGRRFNGIFLDRFGYVHPCCHTAVVTTFPHRVDKSGDQERLFLENKDRINLYHNDIDSILDQPYFKGKWDMKFSTCRESCFGRVMNYFDKADVKRIRTI